MELAKCARVKHKAITKQPRMISNRAPNFGNSILATGPNH